MPASITYKKQFNTFINSIQQTGQFRTLSNYNLLSMWFKHQSNTILQSFTRYFMLIGKHSCCYSNFIRTLQTLEPAPSKTRSLFLYASTANFGVIKWNITCFIHITRCLLFVIRQIYAVSPVWMKASFKAN